jgi:hypothetical protein
VLGFADLPRLDFLRQNRTAIPTLGVYSFVSLSHYGTPVCLIKKEKGKAPILSFAVRQTVCSPASALESLSSVALSSEQAYKIYHSL